MKIVFMPKTKLGNVSVTLFLIALLLVSYFLMMVNVFDQRGSETFFSNLNLAIPMLLAFTCCIASLIFGVAAITKSTHTSILVIFITLISFLVTIYGVAEIAFPH